MRLLFLTGVAVAAISGAFGIYSTTVSNNGDGFPEHYLALLRRAPDQLNAIIASALPDCIPSDIRPSLSDRGVADLAVKTYFKSGILMAEGKTEEQSSEEFIRWILEEAKSLSESQKDGYRRLLNGGLTSRETIFCVVSSIKEALATRIDVEASGWDLRG